VQTFLPYADFAATASVLDPSRLGKQRVEAPQIVRAVTVPGYGWRHHPAARMWRGYEEALGAYGVRPSAGSGAGGATPTPAKRRYAPSWRSCGWRRSGNRPS